METAIEKSAMEKHAKRSGGVEKLASYRVGRLLGKGGMGEVYEAWDVRLERRVALKRVRTRHQRSGTVLQRLRREARALARIHHPSVVQVFDLVETRDGGFIVMELAEGVTLHAMLRSGPLAPAIVGRLARDLLDGLSASHEAGIIHRDLKAGNVMIVAVSHPRPGDAAIRARLLDFGIARDLRRADNGSSTADFTGIAGTPTAMSPEQVFGLEPDERSDLFCLGILLYEMLTGISPFHACSAITVLERVCSFEPPPVRSLDKSIPARLSAFIDHLLEKDPLHRPQNARQAIAALDEIIANLPLEARPTQHLRSFSRHPEAAPVETLDVGTLDVETLTAETI